MLTTNWPFSEDPQPWRQAHSGSNVLTINWPFSEVPWSRRQHTNSPKHSSCYVLCVQFCFRSSYFSSSLIWYHYSQKCWVLSKKAKRLKSNLWDTSMDPGELASLTAVLLISLPFLGILSLSSNKPGVSAQLLFFHSIDVDAGELLLNLHSQHCLQPRFSCLCQPIQCYWSLAIELENKHLLSFSTRSMWYLSVNVKQGFFEKNSTSLWYSDSIIILILLLSLLLFLVIRVKQQSKVHSS